MGILKCELFESLEAQDYAPAVLGPKLDKLVEERPDTHVYAFRGTLRYFEAIPPDPGLPEKKREKPYQPALSDFNEAVNRNDSNALAYSGMGNVYYDLGRFDDFLEKAKKAHQLAPRDPSFKYNYANALYANKRYNDAIEEYTDLTFVDSQFMWAYHDLAQLYRLTDATAEYDPYSNLYISQSYYEHFINMLEDKEVTSLDNNQGPVTYTTGPDSYPVLLAENPEKRYYAYYGIALTSYLLGQPEDAEGYVNKAKAVQVDPNTQSEIERLIEYDVKLLQEEQQWLSKQANDFSKKYLTQSNLGL
jgi:tetratricopeptide (TPR) repeat protein